MKHVGRAGDAAQVRAHHVLGDPVRPNVLLQLLGKARYVEPESIGVRHPIGHLQLVLVLEQLVVHLPEPALTAAAPEASATSSA